MRVVTIPIRDILETRDKSIRVEFDDGSTAWLSRRKVQISFGRVTVPERYARMIGLKY